MIARNYRFLLAALGLFAMAAACQAQNRDPHIGYIYPPGGKQGTTTTVLVGGQFLNNLTNAVVSGSGVTAEIIRFIPPINGKEKTTLQDAMRETQKKLQVKKKESGKDPGGDDLVVCPPDIREVDISSLSSRGLRRLRTKINPPKNQANAQLAHLAEVRLTMDKDARPGRRELRLVTKNGLTNPMDIHVGQLDEVKEQEPNDRAAPGDALTLPVTVTGQVMPGDRDRFRFTAKKGQNIVVIVQARSLVPYLADAVPGWFQALATLYDAEGREVAFVDDYTFDPDPVLHVEIPQDGEYELEIRDSIYRGREDFVYRASIGELPFVTGIFPLGGPAGDRIKAEVTGWNLPGNQLTLTPGELGPGVHVTTMKRGGLVSNPVRFSIDDLPEAMEKQNNDSPRSAQRIRETMIINGRIETPGDQDCFEVSGKAGDTIVAEVYARRLGSPLDAVLFLTDRKGKELARNDDHVDKGAGLTTHHADSCLSFTLPEDGTYIVHLRDTQDHGGITYAYRLRIGEARPDFRLRIIPSSLNLRKGQTALLTAVALRQDGFDGGIDLDLKDTPGFKISGGRIPAGQDKIRFTVSAPNDLEGKIICLDWLGRANIAGTEVIRPAVAAEDVMQAFLYRHLVPVENFTVGVVPSKWPWRSPAVYKTQTPLNVIPGKTIPLEFTIPGRKPRKDIFLELRDGPEGFSITDVTHGKGTVSVSLEVAADKITPGQKSNLIITAMREFQPKNKDGSPRGQKRRQPMGVLPAIPFEIASP